jgi:predicted permease
VSLWRHLTAGVRVLSNPRQRDADLDDEVRHWLESAVAERIRGGMSPAEADRHARLALGGADVVKERVRAAGWEAVVESIGRDFRRAVRGLIASPGFTLVAVATLSVGVAVTTTELTVSNTVLRQHWPVPEPSRVFTIISVRGGPSISPAGARYLSAHATTFVGIIAVRCLSGMRGDCRMSVNGSEASVDFVSGNYFTVLGLRLRAGRGFADDEDRLDAPSAVAVISDALWRNRLGADPGVIGSTIRIDEVPFTIVGVASPDFTGTRTERKDIWLPLSAMLLVRPHDPETREQLVSPSGDRSEAAVAGRLAPGVTADQARAELATLQRAYLLEHQLKDHGVRLMPTTFFPNPAKLATAAGLFALMFGAVTLVLLLTCANVGNLLLARAAARAREIAICLALGASRRRVVRQMLTESLLLALVAGAIGVAASFVIPGAIMTRVFGDVSWQFAPDAVVIGIATFIAALTCVAFGLAPALHATRADVGSVLKSGDPAAGGSASRARLRDTLLAVQVAISLLLLVDAGLLVRGIQRAHEQNPGFRTKGIVVLSFELPPSYDSTRIWAFSRQLMSETRTVAGTPVAFASNVPFGSSAGTRFRLVGDAPTVDRVSNVIDVSPSFFDVLGMPVVAGRGLTPSDDETAVLVNQTLARDLWGDENPLGKVILEGDGARQVVGVVRDASLYRIDRVEGVVFRPIGRRRAPAMMLQGPTPATTQAVAALAARVDSRVQVHVDSIAGNVDRQLEGLRATATLASILGVVALFIAAIGVFGVFAYVVQARTREIGIRTALGASTRRVVGLMVRESSRAILAGLGGGIVLAVATGRVLGSVLYGATVFDPMIIGVTALTLTVVGILATWIPARRAARIDPVTALRTD